METNFVLEERREKRNPGPFATQAIPNTSQKTKKYIGKERKERLPPRREFFITSQMMQTEALFARAAVLLHGPFSIKPILHWEIPVYMPPILV